MAVKSKKINALKPIAEIRGNDAKGHQICRIELFANGSLICIGSVTSCLQTLDLFRISYKRDKGNFFLVGFNAGGSN